MTPATVQVTFNSYPPKQLTDALIKALLDKGATLLPSRHVEPPFVRLTFRCPTSVSGDEMKGLVAATITAAMTMPENAYGGMYGYEFI